MVKRLIAIALIFIGASVAWTILGATILVRTQQSDDAQLASLTSQWDSDQTQFAPTVNARIGKTTVDVPVRSSRINVGLDLEQRRKGLLWYNLYDVAFSARYTIRNDTTSDRLYLHLASPSSDGTFADFACSVGGRPLAGATLGGDVPFDLAPGATTTIDVAYRSRGMNSWSYRFGVDVQSANDFALTMTTDFDAIDFPPHSLSPTRESRSGKGWQLDWRYSSIVTGNGIGMTFPYPLQPGPLAQRITFWAPVALLFYFFVMLLITTLRKVDLHPVNYFFLACAFFAFHLLFAYLVDRISIEAAFTICSLVSMLLTITYLRLVAGWRFAAVESGLAQLVYLILFSYALFNEGWSGLSITIGAIVTLFVAMQATGRIRWSERFDRRAEA